VLIVLRIVYLHLLTLDFPWGMGQRPVLMVLEGLMSSEILYEKARLHMGKTQEERLRKARARTFVMTKILAKQAKAQTVTEEMLARTCNL